MREWLWHITVIPCPLVVCLICSPSALGLAALRLQVYVSSKPLVSMMSRFMVVSHTAKQSRAHSTTVCYIHERSILIERSPKACCKKYLMKKRVLLKPLTIIRHLRLTTHLFYSVISYGMWAYLLFYSSPSPPSLHTH